ncbi:TIGR02680 family protein [Amycolatopsis acidicola]|uniref:TIGR02680 family protein n=1 Tax=Amycolatopsis acidicola TaxID=2596893 RepID=A0A5N0V7A1_9PSEU|nr:TIGR02680 family protein [Amycolatopsis acidicola]KAA9161584.1 TIGR02680 family protein [Amycolatopsis acidicola]
MTIAELPHHPTATIAATPHRWRPTRAGILNIWRYYDEIFEFHRGRLLLRGPNGTGKSKALELLLPFLFDASLRPHRLSTFGTAERTMHWNLMGEGATGATRVGYVWLEFENLTGRDEYFTCGARLQATTRTTGVTPDYFTTSLRIGTDFTLTNSANQPLTRAVLADTLGEHGIVHASPSEYRAAVRQALFPGLSEQRYEALITALLQLRTPKLSQRLDPGLLSSLLSRALPPLDQEDIAELAEGFERLDQQRERLKALDEEVDAAKKVAARQKSYAQRALRKAAAELISSTTRMDDLTRAARRSEEEYESATKELAATESSLAETTRRVNAAQSAIEGIVASEAYRGGQQLDELRDRVGIARRAAAGQQAKATEKLATAQEDEEKAEAARRDIDERTERVRAAHEDSGLKARRAGLTTTHSELAETLGSTGDRLLQAAVTSRLEAIKTVSRALDVHEKAVDARKAAEDILEEAREKLSKANENREKSASRYQVVVQEHERALLRWASECRELHFAEPAELAGRAESETDVLAYVHDVAELVVRTITLEEARLDGERQSTEKRREALTVQLERLRSEVDLPPDAPPYRTAARENRPGAPFWRLVDFAEGFPAEQRPLVEAALQSSGLLDAWVASTDGTVTVEGHDAFADGTLLAPAPGGSLRDVFRPEPGSAVPAERLDRLLSAIAFGETLPEEHPAAYGADGTWRLGALTGSWEKEDVSHLGAAARERTRQRRIAELSEELEETNGEITRLTEQLALLESRRRAVAVERKRLPSFAPVAETRQALDQATDRVTQADSAVHDSLGKLIAREEDARGAQHELHLAATEHNAPTSRAGLEDLGSAVESFRAAAVGWLARHTELTLAARTAATLDSAAARSAAEAAELAAAAEEAAEDAENLAEKLRAVERTVDTDDYNQILEELRTQRELRDHLRTKESAARDRAVGLHTRLGQLQERRHEDAAKRDSAVEARDVAAGRFRGVAVGTLAEDAEAEVALSTSDGVTATLRAAQSVAAKWPVVPHEQKNVDDALHRLREVVYETRDTLGARAELELSDDETRVLTAVLDGVRISAHTLLETLKSEAGHSREDITERERELFDRTLTGDTRRQLAERIRQAGELVDAMNARLERVRTASRVSVQLVWQVDEDLPAGTKEARQLLLKDPARLSDADRESLHRFFRERVDQAKEDNTAATWQEQLAQVFDYTAWHRFVVKLDRSDGRGWQPLTKKLHGALSGGEKAIALHLPLFAAVAAHYQAVPGAPRLILLDEVFVGVDSSNRGQVFELLTSLDLDLVLTSDHEWCTYREIPGIAVHNLLTGDDGDNAVTTARFVWTGEGWADEDGE